MRSQTQMAQRSAGQRRTPICRFGTWQANPLKSRLLFVTRPTNELQRRRGDDAILEQIDPFCKPFDLVLLSGAVRVLWPTTDRTHEDKFSVREQNGTMN